MRRTIPAWLVLVGLFGTVCLLALWGLKQGTGWRGLIAAPDLPDKLYGIIQLFVVEGRLLSQTGAAPAGTPWQLQAAAFAAPVVTIFAFLQLVWTDIADWSSGLLHRRVFRGHVVIVGLGWRGQVFARDCLARGLRVVAIDAEAKVRVAIPAEQKRFRFLCGDIEALDILQAAGASRAASIVVFCGDDYANIAVARTISERLGALRRHRRNMPRIICHANASAQRDQAVADQALAELAGPRIEFFSPEEAAARQCVATYPPGFHARVLRRARPHLALYGDGPLVGEMIRQIAVVAQEDAQLQPVITVYSTQPSALDALARRVAPIATLRIVAQDPGAEGVVAGQGADPSCPVTQHVICLADARRAADLALAIRGGQDKGGPDTAPVLVAPSTFGPFAGWKDPGLAQRRPYPSTLISTFGEVPNVLGWTHVVAQEHDLMARASHRAYLDAMTGGTPGQRGRRAALRPWAELDEVFRQSNRSLVDHIPVKLGLVGCMLAETGDRAVLTEAEIAVMAQAEHNRWRAERLLAGWRHDECRDDRRRLHPDLLPWNDLPADRREKVLDLVRALPDLAEKAGKIVVRRIRIGVSGHRDRTISAANRSLAARIDAALRTIQADHPGHAFEIASPLARGADQLVADRAMAVLGARLIVPLPMRLEEYCHDFGEAGEPGGLAAFHGRLAKAGQVFEMPLLGPGPDADARQMQYRATGAWLLQHCDHMLFLWDGKPAAGPGGTGEIADWARAGRVPAGLEWPGGGAVRAAAHLVPVEGRETPNDGHKKGTTR